MTTSSEAFAQAGRDPAGRRSVGWYLCAVAAGLLVPCEIVIVGVIARLLELRTIDHSPVRLGDHLAVPMPQAWLALSPLMQLTYLVGIGLVLGLLFALVTWRHRRGSEICSRQLEEKLHRDLFKHALSRAEVEGAISQRERVKMLVDERLPQLSRGLVSWRQAMPRSLLLLAGTVAVAMAVNVPLALLALISGLMLWQFYQWVRSRAEDETSDWELPRSRRRLVDLISQSPLLVKTHTGAASDQAFEAELESMMQQVTSRHAARTRPAPLLAVAVTLVVALLLLGLGVNLLTPDSNLSVSSALVLGLSLAGATAAATRLAQAYNHASTAGEAARSIYQFLSAADDVSPSEQRVGLGGLREAILFEDVELGIEGGAPVLSGVSLKFLPGELVALMGTRPVAPLALAELTLGIGRPNRGRILVDGIELKDIHPRSLNKVMLWVAAEGPICEGTLWDNLVGDAKSPDGQEVMSLARSLGLDNLLSRLEDGLQSTLTAGDRRLTAEEKYAIGIARAVIHKPPVIVVQEPPQPPDEIGEDKALEALKKLAAGSSLVLVLPRRLSTLRAADRVVLLNGPKLAGEGKHSGLLQTSELYRHLNYLLFNPYRTVS